MFHYINTLIMFKHVNFGKHIWIQRQKLKKYMLFLKFHPGMKCLHVFFFFFSPQDEVSSLSFWQGWVHPPDEISSRQKRVNSKRYFTIDSDDFVPGWNFACKHPLAVCNRLLYFLMYKLGRSVGNMISLSVFNFCHKYYYIKDILKACH